MVSAYQNYYDLEAHWKEWQRILAQRMSQRKLKPPRKLGIRFKIHPPNHIRMLKPPFV